MMLWSKTSFPQNSLLLLGILFVGLVPLLMYFLNTGMVMLMEWDLCLIGSISVSFVMMMDKMGLMFSMTVLLISFSVMLFSVTYMSGDMNLNYFIIMVMLFVMSMNMLIYIPHLLFLLLGWDGLGLSSYLLVIYYQNESSLSAGMITGVTNRVGDALLILGGSWAFMFGHWNQVFNYYNSGFWLMLVIIFAAMTKSAQMPFSAWLPAAMAAPTPVSSLVHSSTLVTAGVYLLIRFYPSFSAFQFFNSYLFWVGFLTCTMAGMSANFEGDLKKIIALSTLSQLGVMFLSLGLGQPTLTFFHLITHALFKALLFICAGTIIHSMQGVQDLRLMGSLWCNMPATCSCLNVANLALCGIPFTAGFYSKDLILEVMFSSSLSLVSWVLLAFSVCLTSAYSVRLSFLTLWSSNKHYSISTKNDESFYTFIPCFILVAGALMGGVFLSWTMTPFLHSFSLPFLIKMFALFFIVLYGSISFWMSVNYLFLPSAHFQSSMWFLGFISSNLFLPSNFSLGLRYNSLEQSWVEVFSGGGLVKAMSKVSKPYTKSQNMSISLIMSMVALVLIILMFCWYRY